MFMPPPLPASKTDAAQQEQDARYYRDVLHELIEIGADLARMVQQKAKAQPDTGPEAVAEFAEAFDRIARAVRRTIGLARRVGEPVPQATGPNGSADGPGNIAARKRIIREVEDTIQRKAKGSEAESLHGELRERLDAPDLDDDLSHLPVDQIIENICRDLGIGHLPGSHPWKRRRPEDVAALCARAAGPRGDPPVGLDDGAGGAGSLHAPSRWVGPAG